MDKKTPVAVGLAAAIGFSTGDHARETGRLIGEAPHRRT